MKIEDLLVEATKFERYLQTFSDSVKLTFVKASQVFFDIYRSSTLIYPSGGGVYIFRVREEIIYIGKATSFKRIWHHVGILDTESNQFLRNRFAGDASMARMPQDVKNELLNGQFYIDCFVIEPVDLRSTFETFLQSVYWLKNQKNLPPGNKVIG